MRVLVCGGRNFEDAALLERTLNEIHDATAIKAVIHGGARGADSLAGAWARTRVASGPVEEIACPANWRRHGNAAGPIRNQHMLAAMRPHLVIAFAGGRGTADMVKRARAAGIEVREIAPVQEEGETK